MVYSSHGVNCLHWGFPTRTKLKNVDSYLIEEKPHFFKAFNHAHVSVHIHNPSPSAFSEQCDHCIALGENSWLRFFKYVSWGLTIGSLKLRVKTPGTKCQLLAPERLKPSQDVTKKRICPLSSKQLHSFCQVGKKPRFMPNRFKKLNTFKNPHKCISQSYIK